MNSKAWFQILIFGFMAFVVGCTEPEVKKLSGGSTPAVPGAPTVSSTSPLAINLSTKFDGQSTEQAATFVETATTSCTATAATPNVTCTVNIPEGRLYYSSVTLKFSWSTDACPLMRFTPYQYQASDADDYFPPASSVSINCSVAADTKADCWGGAARDLVTEFPKYRSRIYLPDEATTGTTTGSATINSALLTGWGSNRWTSNSLVDKTIDRTSAALGFIGDGYVADSMLDYVWTCRDQWADPQTYSITLKVNDVDTGAAGLNEILTWQGF
jgi:hypothetical protein